MPNSIDDAELHRIVMRVIGQIMGTPRPAPSASAQPVSNETAVGSAESAQPANRKVVVIGSDHGGFDLKENLKNYLTELGFEVMDIGTYTKGSVDYPEFAHEVARRVASGKAWRGIMVDGAGIGSCIVANKVPGVRAGMAYDYSSALNSREHNDTNVLTLGAGLIGVNLARQIVKTWLSTEFGGGRHARRVDMIAAIEKNYLK